MRRGWKEPRQVPPPRVSSNPWEKATAQGAPLLFAFRSVSKLPAATAKIRNVLCAVKMRAQILLVGPKYAGDQDTRSWERPHGVCPAYPLIAKHKFPIYSREGKHPGQHQAGVGSQLGRFRTPQEGWEDPTWGTAGWAPSQPGGSRQLREQRQATPAIPAAWHHRCARCGCSNCHWDGCQSSTRLQPPPPRSPAQEITQSAPSCLHATGGPPSPPTLLSPGVPPGWGEQGGRRWGVLGQPRSAQRPLPCIPLL